jgi:hypothetical protein
MSSRISDFKTFRSEIGRLFQLLLIPMQQTALI